MPVDQAGLRVPFDNTYARLPARFYARVAPIQIAAQRIVHVNHDLAALLGLNPAALDPDMLTGNRLPTGAEPTAQAYAGHQFGALVHAADPGRAGLASQAAWRARNAMQTSMREKRWACRSCQPAWSRQQSARPRWSSTP